MLTNFGIRHAHRLLNRDSLRMALDANGYVNVPVEVSSTPYRG
jgi:hypothetical protein